ncbi:hypothetical protein KJ652_00705 [Patescibacteria group bacterium]|nr:hypothetical protein [Patescibacteria group bacterium]MBU1123091.1 hypothetical protein [Patescibacteria group bacterium]MBU1911725.1 hypothetical protein [Patescibacteria group bacterium]
MNFSFPKSPKQIATTLIRISFGLSLLFVGLAHYMTFEAFKMVAAGGLGGLEFLGIFWAYIMPALMILGGALYVIGKYDAIAAWTTGLALGSIPVGMLLKSVVSLESLVDMMPMAINAFVWMIIYYIVVKSSSCEGCCKKMEQISEDGN